MVLLDKPVLLAMAWFEVIPRNVILMLLRTHYAGKQMQTCSLVNFKCEIFMCTINILINFIHYCNPL